MSKKDFIVFIRCGHVHLHTIRVWRTADKRGEVTESSVSSQAGENEEGGKKKKMGGKLPYGAGIPAIITKICMRSSQRIQELK